MTEQRWAWATVDTTIGDQHQARCYGDRMSQNKTVPKARSAREFVASLAQAQRRADNLQMLELLRTVTGLEPVMWGSSIVGFGTHHYRYESGREGDTVAVGFAPRAQALVLYGLEGHGQNLDLA